MTEYQKDQAKMEKICLDHECQEQWSELPADLAKFTMDFIYCPYCSEELNLQCSVCRESLSSKDFKFCPWCGSKFEE